LKSISNQVETILGGGDPAMVARDLLQMINQIRREELAAAKELKGAYSAKSALPCSINYL
jgi:hypothetical protein